MRGLCAAIYPSAWLLESVLYVHDDVDADLLSSDAKEPQSRYDLAHEALLC